MMIVLAALAAFLSVSSAGLYICNLRQFRYLPQDQSITQGLSVLIPARNEEKRIASALRSLLSCRGVEMEIIVLDDGSSDQTAQIVRGFSKTDSRVRLETSAACQNGWCGKNFACHQLANFARYPFLLFLDADVRVIQPAALSRLVGFMETRQLALVSGFPRQETRSFAEKLIVPLIQFVLLAFLPIGRMRRTTNPAFAAACGQVMVVRRETYKKLGGHAAIAACLHDGLMLARRFRDQGFATDIFDGSDSFECRMYQDMPEVWNGFLKNAHEGLGAPKLIAWTTFLLLGGQVLPFLLVIALSGSSVQWLAWLSVLASLLPRFIGAARFRESMVGAILHPIGVLALVMIQWTGLIRSLAKQPVEWKGRSYRTA